MNFLELFAILFHNSWIIIFIIPRFPLVIAVQFPSPPTPFRWPNYCATHLWEPTGTVVLTSATLAADDSDRFLFLRKRLGLDDALCKRLDSPFDYQKQARLLLNETFIDPNSDMFVRAVSQWFGDFIDESKAERLFYSPVIAKWNRSTTSSSTACNDGGVLY